MEDLLIWIQNNWTWLLQAIQSLATLVFGMIIVIQNRNGKDIDGDGIPDVSAKFNGWYVIIGGDKYFLKDMEFFKEDEKR